MSRSYSSRTAAFGVALLLSVSSAFAQSEAVIAHANLPRDLSPLAMFMAADWVVKTIMLGLVACSILTWTIFVVKVLEFRRARAAMRESLNLISQEATLSDAAARLTAQHATARAMIEETLVELHQSKNIHENDGIKERVASRLGRMEAASVVAINTGTGALATIGSTSPFIGLFGTVWGIMNAFIGISKAQTTNLAVVAPGIAEALLATAIGLFAAIPAVIIYNHFTRSSSGYRALIISTSAAIQRCVSRDLDRGTKLSGPRALAAE